MRQTILPLLVLGLLLTAEARAQVIPRWRWTTGGAVGAMFSSGDIGRHPNATGGHESLIASLGGGVALGAQAGFESRFGGIELRGLQSTSAVEVRNEFGVAFPNHGGRPFAWTGSVLVYPLAPLQGRPSRPVRPFLAAGLGGVLLSVDLDNVKGQTLYHSFQWVLGGGIRIASSPEDIPSWTPTFVELRLTRSRVWQNGPLQQFDIWAATAALGMRF